MDVVSILSYKDVFAAQYIPPGIRRTIKSSYLHNRISSTGKAASLYWIIHPHAIEYIFFTSGTIFFFILCLAVTWALFDSEKNSWGN